MKVFGIIVLVLGGFMALSVVAAALNLITIPWLKFTTQVQTNRDIVTKTYNADNVLYNYRWFKDRVEAIKALEVTIDQSEAAITRFEASAGARKDWTFEDKNEHARLSAVLQGQSAQYNTIVGEYNSRMKQADRSIFAEELPLFFDLRPY